MVRSSAPDEIGTVKVVAEVAVPFGVVTEIAPVVAAAGTVVVIWLALVTAKVAAVPLNFTEVVPVKLVPLMVTEAPADPLVGETAVIVGVVDIGAGEELPPPPQAPKTIREKTTGTSFAIVLQADARSTAISIPFFDAFRGRARNGGVCTCGQIKPVGGRELEGGGILVVVFVNWAFAWSLLFPVLIEAIDQVGCLQEVI